MEETLSSKTKLFLICSIGLAIHMSSPYHLAYNYLSLIQIMWSRHLKSYLSNMGENRLYFAYLVPHINLIGNIWFPHRKSNPGRLGENQKSLRHIFLFLCFIALTLSIVFVFKLTSVCLGVLLSFKVFGFNSCKYSLTPVLYGIVFEFV